MCTLSKDERIAVKYAFERICFRRNGSTSVTLDLLLEHCGKEPIRGLRVWVPYALVRVPKAMPFVTWWLAEKSFAFLYRLQVRKVKIRCESLAVKKSRANWAYQLPSLQHVAWRNRDPRTGKLTLERVEPKTFDSDLTGVIKFKWKAKRSEELVNDPWKWFLFTANGITQFDIVVRDDDTVNHFRKEDGRMWLRMEFSVPASGIHDANRYSLWERLFARSRTYVLKFLSPDLVNTWVKDKLEGFDPQKLEVGEAGIVRLEHSWNEVVKDFLPSHYPTVEIRDWRSFMYSQPGLKVFDPKQLAAEPPKLLKWYHELPSIAFGFGWLVSKRPRVVHECWIGTDYGRYDSQGYDMEILSAWDNRLQAVVLPLLGLLGFVLSVLRYLGW